MIKNSVVKTLQALDGHRKFLKIIPGNFKEFKKK